MEIFSSTMPSAKSSLPRAMAPTKTAIECVSGMRGRYSESRSVCASPDSAASSRSNRRYSEFHEITLTDLVCVGGEMIRDGVLSTKAISWVGLPRIHYPVTYLDDLEQLLRTIHSTDAQGMQQLDLVAH